MLAVLGAMSARGRRSGDGAPLARPGDPAFELLGGDAGIAYCREVERGPGVAAGSAIAE